MLKQAYETGAAAALEKFAGRLPHGSRVPSSKLLNRMLAARISEHKALLDGVTVSPGQYKPSFESNRVRRVLDAPPDWSGLNFGLSRGEALGVRLAPEPEYLRSVHNNSSVMRPGALKEQLESSRYMDASGTYSPPRHYKSWVDQALGRPLEGHSNPPVVPLPIPG